MSITINDQEPFDASTPVTIIRCLSNLATQIRLLSGADKWNEIPPTNLSQLSPSQGWNIINSNSQLVRNQGNLIKSPNLVVTVPILNEGDSFSIASISQNTLIDLNGYSCQGSTPNGLGLISVSNQPQVYVYDSASGIIDLKGQTIAFPFSEVSGQEISSNPSETGEAFDGNINTFFSSVFTSLGDAEQRIGYTGNFLGRSTTGAYIRLVYVRFAPSQPGQTSYPYGHGYVGAEIRGYNVSVGAWVSLYIIQQTDVPFIGNMGYIYIGSSTPCAGFILYTEATTELDVAEVSFWGV